MAGKKKIRRALIEGATQGLVGSDLYAFVRQAAPDAPEREARAHSAADAD